MGFKKGCATMYPVKKTFKMSNTNEIQQKSTNTYLVVHQDYIYNIYF